MMPSHSYSTPADGRLDINLDNASVPTNSKVINVISESIGIAITWSYISNRVIRLRAFDDSAAELHRPNTGTTVIYRLFVTKN